MLLEKVLRERREPDIPDVVVREDLSLASMIGQSKAKASIMVRDAVLTNDGPQERNRM